MQTHRPLTHGHTGDVEEGGNMHGVYCARAFSSVEEMRIKGQSPITRGRRCRYSRMGADRTPLCACIVTPTPVAGPRGAHSMDGELGPVYAQGQPAALTCAHGHSLCSIHTHWGKQDAEAGMLSPGWWMEDSE